MDKKILIVIVVAAIAISAAVLAFLFFGGGNAVVNGDGICSPGETGPDCAHSEPICNNNGSCVAPENQYNCPGDCRTPRCMWEGESFIDAGVGGPIESDAVTECCEGLQKKDTYENTEGCIINKGPRYVCVKCGDGICGLGENECNCPGDCNNTNEKYCTKDEDCVRQASCCDCGLGNYVNKRYFKDVQCEIQCMCATQLSFGKCVNNECTGVAGMPEPQIEGVEL